MSLDCEWPCLLDSVTCKNVIMDIVIVIVVVARVVVAWLFMIFVCCAMLNHC